jgi:hypothetical protein
LQLALRIKGNRARHPLVARLAQARQIGLGLG